MRIIKKEVNGNEYMFVCETWDRSNAWGHKCTLFVNGNEYETDSCRYYNRTWERYTYQSVCIGCIQKLIQKWIESEKYCFKRDHGYKRLTKERNERLEKKLEKNERLNELKAVLEMLK